MTIDVPHLIATIVVMAIALFVSGKLGWHEKGKFSWKLFGLVLVLLLGLNLLWPITP